MAKNDRYTDVLDRMASSGNARGADDIYARSHRDASLEGDYTDADVRSRSHRPVILAVAAVALVLLGVGVLAARAGDEAPTAIDTASGTGDSTGQPPPSAPDDAAYDELMANIEQGWIPFQGFVIGTGAEGPRGVVPAGYRSEAPDFRTPVYDAPDGNLIGYEYGSLGYLPLDVADAGTFDATAARIEMYGCDSQMEPCSNTPLAGSYLEGLAQLDVGR